MQRRPAQGGPGPPEEGRGPVRKNGNELLAGEDAGGAGKFLSESEGK